MSFGIVPGSMRHLRPGECRRLMRSVTRGNRPDPHTPAQRAAIERRRIAFDERDRERFRRESAHLPTDAFRVIPPDDHPLLAGLGERRQNEMTIRWFAEPTRRKARTAHAILAERRLYGRP